VSVKERVHHLVNELSEADLLVAERVLRGLRLPPEEPTKPTPEQRRAAHEQLQAAIRGKVTTDAYFREKHEELAREEARLRGQEEESR